MAGIVVMVLGIIVAVVAVVALQKPSGNRSASSTDGSAASTTAPTPSSSSSAGASPGRSSGAARTSAAPSTPADSSPASRTAPGVKSIPLVVLNNTTTSGLASTAAQQFETGGWTVTSFGNLSNSIESTCAYYDPAVKGAKSAALALMAQYPTIKRVKEKFAELPAGPVVVVLTPDYSSD